MERRPPGRHRWAKPSERRLADQTHGGPKMQCHSRWARSASATCSDPAGPRQSDMFPGRSGYSDMFASSRSPPERHVPRQVRLLRHVRLQPIPLERHVPRADPATATCWAPADPARATCSPADPATATCSPPTDPARATCSPGRPGYCDMLGSSRPRQSDMFPRQVRLLRHVRLQPIPLERHVRATPGRSGYRLLPPERHVVRLLRHVRLQPIPLERHVVPARATCSPGRDPATATCSAPADPARATCSPGRPGYCDMFGSSRPRSDMFPGRLQRHVRLQPIPLERHVPPGRPASATCSDPADPARATCSPADPATATCSPPRQIRLLRHVGLQPTPPERHVLPADRSR